MAIVPEFGKFRYNRLPMGMCASGDKFQDKVDKLLGDIKGVKIYNNDMPVLINEILYKNIEQLGIIFSRFCAAGLKLNATKCSFGLKEIPYLGYIITTKGLIPDPKKVQGIIDLGRTTTTT